MRFAFSPRVAAAVFVLVSGIGAPASAQEPAAVGLLELARAGGEQIAGQDVPPPLQIDVAAPAAQFTIRDKRPAALRPLYTSLIALNVLDVHSTYAALGSGNGREANPVIAKVIDRPAAFVAVKAGTTAMSIWTAEKLWKRNRVAAVLVVGAANAALAAVVANNYNVARK